MDTEELRKLIKTLTGDRIFGVTFVKKDKSIRDMTCKLGVKKHLKGGELPYDPVEKGLLPVFDMQKGEYRTVNLKTLTEIRANGQVYKIKQD